MLARVWRNSVLMFLDNITHHALWIHGRKTAICDSDVFCGKPRAVQHGFLRFAKIQTAPAAMSEWLG